MNIADPAESIAIVGMAGRFPQATNLDEFWAGLREGKEAISFFQAEEVQWLPIEPPPVTNDPHFVRARATLDRPEWFDAGFFRLNPREAAIMDPQQRVFLECAWEALENAGCDAETFAGSIGVFAGAGFNSYLFNNLLTNRDLLGSFGLFAALTLNEKDYLSTRVAYKLNLRGPSINVQTACSTSLVAVCLACQNLLDYHCDAALAGGVSISFPTNRGHRHVEGGIMSRDGHCRSFDAKASGTVVGSGAGVVVLKRLSDAVEAGDRIYAIVKGSAINNDGGVKIGFTAPSIDGQAECIAMAHAMAGCQPETISYIEAHGTGTPLGDPIEIAALTKAFGAPPGTHGFCAIGSVKTNIGHLDAAAGVAGLIKTTLALHHEAIPPSLHYETPNPEIDFAHSPFFVNDRLRPWPRGATPRRAGVSSFGIGGTNAHVLLEEAPAPKPAPASRLSQLLLLSARTPAALDAATDNLAAHLERHPAMNLADVAFTLQTGRKAFEHRRAVVVDRCADAVAALRSRDGPRVVSGGPGESGAGVVFMFPGQGAQAVNMARELYEVEAEFRGQVDRCCEILTPQLGLDLRQILFPGSAGLPPGAPPDARDDAGPAEAARLLTETRITQPALFVIEHALARQWMQWGIAPAAMIGHSLGEYVAATLAGVFSLDDALALVAERGRLMQAQPAGAMLAIRLPEAGVTPWLHGDLAVGAVNASGMTVVSGRVGAIEVLQQKLAAAGVVSKRLATSHAFHSAMMEPALAPFANFMRRMVLSPPRIRWVSNLTGTWITPHQATSADYWTTHLRRTVRFADGLGELVRAGHRILLEVGPGHTLSSLARQHPAVAANGIAAFPTLGEQGEGRTDSAAMLHALGQLWVAGVKPDWREGFHALARRRVVTLPTYPFERQRHWIEPGTAWAADALPTGGATVPESAPAAASPVVSVTASDAIARNGASTLSAVKRIFQDLSGLDLSQTTADRTFNQLGFDSLFLTQASAEIGRRLGVAIAFRQLRDDLSTFGRLAGYVDRHAVGPAPVLAAVVSEIQPRSAATEKRVPLTEAQREMWMVSQLGAAASLAYTESATLQLTGSLDVDALRRALQELVARHEALRTTFAAAGDVQLIAGPTAIELAFQDFSAAAGPLATTAGGERDAAAKAAAWLSRKLEEPFQLEPGPLFRPALARIDAEHHCLALIVHHIICDGWSLGILVRELSEIYAAGIARRRPALPPAPLFSEYALQQGAAGRETAFAAAEAYWRSHFADAVPILDLPTDRPRPATRTYAGDFVSCTLSPGRMAAVKRFCSEHDTTVFTTMLAVFSVLLHRLTGQDDVVIGVPAAGQALAGHPDLVGHLANLLPVRSRIGAHQRFNDHVAEVQRNVNDALAHGQYPFVRVLQQLKLPRDSSRVPLTPVLFNTTHHRGTVKLADVVATLAFQPKRFVNFDLNFSLALTEDALALGCYFSTELFDRSTVSRWLGHFETLLSGILAEPQTPVMDVPLLTEAERHTLLVDWNATRLEYHRDACIHSLFEDQVRCTPDAVAVVDGTERISYNELNRRADRLAAPLRAAGVKPEVLVGIFLDRTAHLLTAILAVLKAGGAYVPLDPAHPPQRRDFIVADSRLSVVVTQHSLLPVLLPSSKTRIVLVDDDAPGAATAPGRNGAAAPDIDPAPNADHLAYVIYTSGSTGQPKGVGVPHRGVVALIAWARRLYRPEEFGGVLAATSATFDVSVFETLVPLCLGGKVILAENILRLPDLPAAAEVTLVSGVPPAIAEIVRSRRIPRAVRTVNVAGEPCPQTLVEALYALPQIERVYDLYGPTETTVYSTGSLRAAGGRATIGRPLANEQVYILDSRQQPVPIGVSGELYIGGDKLARGYLNRPELTAEKFLVLPFLPGRRLYRTGDRARFLADGAIEFLGRLDRQVKIRGYRIEPGEIEAALRAHRDVLEAVVVARPGPGGVQLVAYVVPARDATVTAAELLEQVKNSLPAPMVPASLALLSRLPRTTSGKVDQAALPEPDSRRADPACTPPRNEMEKLLSEIWREVLGLEVAGVHDNFFMLGGHSLHAMQVVSRVQESLAIELTLQQFFTAPTIAGLATIGENAILRDIADLPAEPESVVTR